MSAVGTYDVPRPCVACAIVGGCPALDDNPEYKIITATCQTKDGAKTEHPFHLHCAAELDDPSINCPAYEFKPLPLGKLHRFIPNAKAFCGGRITHVNGIAREKFVELNTEHFV